MDTDQVAEQPFITVAIPTLNEAAHIGRTLDRLLGGYPVERMEIVVADGGSTDATRDEVLKVAARAPQVRFIANPGRIQSCAVNLVAREADERSRYLVRADAHAGYGPDFLQRVVDRLEHSGAASVVTVMDTVGVSCFQRGVAAASNSAIGAGGSAHRQGNYCGPIDHGHHAGFRLDMFRRLGGYDEQFAWNEDAEYDTRVRGAGGVIFLDSAIRLDYFPRATPGALARQYFRYGRGRAMTALKHRSRLRLRQMAPVAVLLVNAGSLVLAPFAPLLLALPTAYMLALTLASAGLAIRLKDRCALCAGLAAALMHHAWAAGFLQQVLFRPRPG